MGGLEKQIKDLIESLYCCIYNKTLKVVKNEDLYKCTLYLHNELFGGVVLAKQCGSDEEFLDFVKEELWKRRLDMSQHASLKAYHNIETFPENNITNGNI